MFTKLKTILVFLALFLGLRVFASDRILEADDISGLVTAANLAGHNSQMGFEKPGGWVASGSPTTATRTSTTSKVYRGTYAYEWDSNAAGQTLTGPAYSVPSDGGPGNRNGVYGCFVKVPSGTATHTFSVLSGSTTIASRTIASSSDYALVTLNFIFVKNTSITPVFTSVSSNEPAIEIDNCFIADADLVNLKSFSQAVVYGTAFWPGTTNCLWQIADGTTGFQNFPADTDCTSPTLTGNATAPSTKVPGFTFASLPAGNYIVVSNGPLTAQTSGVTANVAFRLSDGTNGSGSGNTYGDATNSFLTTTNGVVGSFTYTTPQSNVTFQMQGKSSSATNDPVIDNDPPKAGLWFQLIYFPLQQDVGVKPEQLGWRVDANIAGANPSLGTSAVTSYTGIENGSLTLTNNSGTQVLTAQIPCSSTNAPSGTTCAAGNESVGVVFTPPGPFPQDVRACATFTWDATTGSSAGNYVGTTFQIVETPTNAQTISAEGRGRAEATAKAPTAAAFTANMPVHVCGTFTFASAGQRALRLMYEQSVNGTPAGSNIDLDADANNGQRDLHWEVYPINQAQPAPVIVNSVTSNTSGSERIERASITGAASGNACTSSPCTILSQSGFWLTSVTRSATGTYTANIASGIFSARPTCEFHSLARGSPNIASCAVGFDSATATALTGIGCARTDTFAAIDTQFEMICMGPR